VSDGRWRNLKVWYLERPDTYRDMARVNQDSRGRRVMERGVYKIKVKGGKSALLAVRGLAEHDTLAIDAVTCKKLGLKVGETREIAFDSVGPLGKLAWSMSASDPAYRTAAQLGAISLILGVLSLMLGVLAFWPESDRARWAASLVSAPAALKHLIAVVTH
jgi:hypothetical protein